MKAKIVVGALLWTLVVTALHVKLNIGTAQLLAHFRALVGLERQQLYVGFLPVT